MRTATTNLPIENPFMIHYKMQEHLRLFYLVSGCLREWLRSPQFWGRCNLYSSGIRGIMLPLALHQIRKTSSSSSKIQPPQKKKFQRLHGIIIACTKPSGLPDWVYPGTRNGGSSGVVGSNLLRGDGRVSLVGCLRSSTKGAGRRTTVCAKQGSSESRNSGVLWCRGIANTTVTGHRCSYTHEEGQSNVEVLHGYER